MHNGILYSAFLQIRMGTLLANPTTTSQQRFQSDCSIFSPRAISPVLHLAAFVKHKVQSFTMKKTLLSLPDDVLERIVVFLLPSPSSESFLTGSMRPVISLSETCRRLQAVVVQQLSIIDYLAPSSYTSACCRTVQSGSLRIDSLIQSAGHRLRILHLPQGYIPRDAAYSALRSCVNIRELSLPVREELDSIEPHEFFSCFSSLEKLTLDLPTPQFILGLCMSEVCLKDAAFTKLPANTATLNALSSFLGRKGPHLNRLRVDVLTEDAKWNYTSSLRGSWVYHEVFMHQEQIILRLSAILGRISEAKKLTSLRELDVSTIPDFSNESTDVSFRGQINFRRLQFAVQSARERNPQIKGLQTLRIRVPSKILQPSIAFMYPWVDPKVDITFSFPHYTLRLPPGASTASGGPSELTEALLGAASFQLFQWQDSWNPHDVVIVLTDLGRQSARFIETLTFGTHLSTIPQYILRQAMDGFVSSLVRFGGTSLKKIRFLSDIPNTAAVLNIATCLGCIDAAPVTELREIQFPADIVMFSPVMMSLATRSGHSVTTLRISDFRNSPVLEGVKDPPRTPDHCIISKGSITGYAQKAEWFLKSLPIFLRIVVRDFPKVETLYMEQTKATRSIGDRFAISRALRAINFFESTSRADASTLRTEISAWSEIPL